jgi:uncharacterized protein YcbK (DUF882 family)
MKFKHYDRMHREWYRDIDARLAWILNDLDRFSRCISTKEVCITCLMRTPEENAAAGGSKYSAHLVGRGADIRCRHYSEPEIEQILEFLKKSWPDELLYVKRHVGTADHIHMNIRWKYAR